MKTFGAEFKYLLLFASLFFTSCKQENGLPPGNGNNGTKYSDANGTFVVVSTANWHTAVQPYGNSVLLDIAGYTNADGITLKCYDQGTVDYPISSQSEPLFSVNGIGISVCQYPASYIFKQSTILKAFRGTDTLKVTLTSGNLEF